MTKSSANFSFTKVIFSIFDKLSFDILTPNHFNSMFETLIADLPTSYDAATGQLFGGKTPIICGCFLFINSCKCMAYDGGQWSFIASFNQPRVLAPSATVTLSDGEEVMVVSGGSYESAGDLASVEAFDGQSWSLDKVAPLPRQVSEHCMIKVDDSVLMTIGDLEFSNGITNSSNFYDGNTNSWTPGFNY